MTKKEKTLRIFKYIGVIFYALITAFLIYMLSLFIVDFIKQVNGWQLGGAILGLIVTPLASIGYIVPITLGIIGTVISNKIQNIKSKRNCIIMTVAPILTAVAIFVTYLIILKSN